MDQHIRQLKLVKPPRQEDRWNPIFQVGIQILKGLLLYYLLPFNCNCIATRNCFSIKQKERDWDRLSNLLTYKGIPIIFQPENELSLLTWTLPLHGTGWVDCPEETRWASHSTIRKATELVRKHKYYMTLGID